MDIQDKTSKLNLVTSLLLTDILDAEMLVNMRIIFIIDQEISNIDLLFIVSS